jgi:hypothetical protein
VLLLLLLIQRVAVVVASGVCAVVDWENPALLLQLPLCQLPWQFWPRSNDTDHFSDSSA